MTPLEAALDYARRGYFVFPCGAGLKSPATQNGWEDATTDEARIRHWWGLNPAYNVAIAAGLSGLFVIDVDPDGIEAWEAMLEADPALMAAANITHLVETPRGGFHVYFRGEGRSSVKKLAKGIDTRGRGGYILAPPSRVSTPESNGVYTVLNEAEPLVAPAVLIDAAARAMPEREGPSLPADDSVWDSPEALQRARAWLQGLSAGGPVAFQGQRNDELFKAACGVLQFGIKPATCYDLLLELWNPYCSPPLGEEEIESTIRSAWRNGEQTRGGKAERPLAEQHKHLIDYMNTDPAMVAARSAEEDELAYLDPISLGEAMDNAKPLEWLVKNCFPKQGVGYLYGPSGTYKTFFALDLAMSIATGYGPNWWPGETREPMPVVYMCAESVEAFKSVRSRAWFNAHPIPGIAEKARRNLRVIEDVPTYEMTRHWARFEENVVRRVNELGFDRPAMIVVDTLSQAMVGRSMKDDAQVGPVARFFRQLSKRLNCLVLLIHHTGKDTSSGLFGSFAWYATADTVISVKREGDIYRSKVIKMELEKQKESPLGLPWIFNGVGEAASMTFKRDWHYIHEEKKGKPKVGPGTEEWLDPASLYEFLKVSPLTTEQLAASLAEKWKLEKGHVQRTLTRLKTGRFKAWVPRGDDVWSVPDNELPDEPIDTSIF